MTILIPLDYIAVVLLIISVLLVIFILSLFMGNGYYIKDGSGDLINTFFNPDCIMRTEHDLDKFVSDTGSLAESNTLKFII